MPNDKPLRFTAEDRDAIRRQSIGVATDVSVELNGVTLYLVPLSVSQATDVFALLKAFVTLRKSADPTTGEVKDTENSWADLVAVEGERVKVILRDVLHDSALATSSADGVEVDEELFEFWFGKLRLVPTLVTLFPKLIDAQGLKTMLGNSSPPTPFVPQA